MKEKTKKVKMWDCNSLINPIVGFRIRPLRENGEGYEIQLGKYAVKCPKSLYEFAVQKENTLQLMNVKYSMF